jgi:hypothetical protein
MNWRWPAQKGNNFVPWYTMIRRGVVIVPTTCCVIVLVVLAGLGWGWMEARRVWKEFM